jgi:hypothetical protein
MSDSSSPFVAMRTSLLMDERVSVLAEIGGYNVHEARGRLFALWAWCADRKLLDAPEDCKGHAVSESVVRQFMGRKGVEAMLADGCSELALAELRPDGLLYLRGTDDCVSRMRANIRNGAAGGQARAAQRRASHSASVVETTTSLANAKRTPSEPVATDQRTDSEVQANEKRTSSELVHRSQITDHSSPENSLSHAIDGTAPPETEYRRHARWWALMQEGQTRLKAKGIKPNTQGFSKNPSPHDANMRVCAKNLEYAGLSADEIDAKVRHALAVAEANAEALGHLDYFNPSTIWKPQNFARLVDMTLEQAKRGPTRPQSRAGPRPGGAIGAATPRNDHPTASAPVPFGDKLR